MRKRPRRSATLSLSSAGSAAAAPTPLANSVGAGSVGDDEGVKGDGGDRLLLPHQVGVVEVRVVLPVVGGDGELVRQEAELLAVRPLVGLQPESLDQADLILGLELGIPEQEQVAGTEGLADRLELGRVRPGSGQIEIADLGADGSIKRCDLHAASPSRTSNGTVCRGSSRFSHCGLPVHNNPGALRYRCACWSQPRTKPANASGLVFGARCPAPARTTGSTP